MYLKDPKTKEKSVTLTMVVISFLAVISASVIMILEHSNTTGPLMELFLTSCGLYFGRRVSLKGNNLTVSQKDDKNVE